MAIKYKVLKDFQLLTDDKKILILKAKTIIEDFTIKNKSELVNISQDIIKNNNDYFAYIDWKEELQNYLKVNKIAQPAVITKKLVPFIESMMSEKLTGKEIIVEKEIVKEVVIEKPKIIEKEVLVEKIVSDNSANLELESKLNKVKLKEEQLDKEIKEVNLKELDLESREKRISERESEYNKNIIELESKTNYINNKESELNVREQNVVEKESNLSIYLLRSDIDNKINEYSQKGFVVDLFQKILREI
jgi:hypothetical protein